MRWTEEQYKDWLRLSKKARMPKVMRSTIYDGLRDNPPDSSNPPFQLPPNEAGAYGKGKLPAIRKMNKWEQEWANELGLRRLAGQVLWWKFEPIKLRLADNTSYSPDFLVLPADGLLQVHEVKGFWRDDARVKIKVAASIFPFKFIAITKVKGEWKMEEF